MSGFFERVDKIKPVFDITYKIVLFVCKQANISCQMSNTEEWTINYRECNTC